MVFIIVWFVEELSIYVGFVWFLPYYCGHFDKILYHYTVMCLLCEEQVTLGMQPNIQEIFK